jgi:hypothetical protein
MRNAIFGLSLLVAVLIASLIWNRSRPVRNDAPRPATFAPVSAPVASESPEPESRFVSGPITESFDLSRTFEPTGDELTLSLLLAANQPEQLPEPRDAGPELAPLPRVARSKFAMAGEEASSPVSGWSQVVNVIQFYLAEKSMEMMLAAQSLKGAAPATSSTDR